MSDDLVCLKLREYSHQMRGQVRELRDDGAVELVPRPQAIVPPDCFDERFPELW